MSTESGQGHYDFSERKRKELYVKYYTAEEIANKTESDADEVGFEFLARAGVDLMSGARLLQAASPSGSVSGTDCKLKPFSRGFGAHPRMCWRLDNLAEEARIHKKDYAKFLTKPKLNFISAPSLQEVQLEITLRNKK